MILKIGIISDIHGYPHVLERALEKLNECSVILVAGDVLYHGPRNPILKGYDPKEVAEIIRESEIPIIMAKGNCDSEVDEMIIGMPFLEYIFYEVDGTRFLVNHGHKISKDELIKLGKFYKADVIIRGHTHMRENEIIEGIQYINPSSPSLPKDNKPGCVVIYEEGIVEFINVRQRGR